jgi:hypothetical protein
MIDSMRSTPSPPPDSIYMMQHMQNCSSERKLCRYFLFSELIIQYFVLNLEIFISLVFELNSGMETIRSLPAWLDRGLYLLFVVQHQITTVFSTKSYERSSHSWSPSISSGWLAISVAWDTENMVKALY